MSATLTPPTKLAGARPPFDPPRFTTFDSSPDDRKEPHHKVVADNVERLIRMVAAWPDEELTVLLRLLEQRRAMVEKELALERELSALRLPPALNGLHSIDFLLKPETDAVGTYLGLLDSLQRAIRATKLKIGLLKDLLPSSDA